MSVAFKTSKWYTLDKISYDDWSRGILQGCVSKKEKWGF